jgi:glutathione S-transferase
MTLPILYSFRRCPYAIRARMAISVSGLTCELREVELRNKPADMIAASPKATVPVMVVSNEHVIEQSLEIMAYTLGRNDPHNWLATHTPDNLALVHFIDRDFKAHLDGYKYPDHTQEDGQDIALGHRDKALAILQGLEKRLENTPYLHGQQLGFCDVAIFPFVRQFAAVNADWFNTQSPPHLQSWLNSIVTSALFEHVMTVFPVWKQGAQSVNFGPA